MENPVIRILQITGSQRVYQTHNGIQYDLHREEIGNVIKVKGYIGMLEVWITYEHKPVIFVPGVYLTQCNSQDDMTILLQALREIEEEVAYRSGHLVPA